MSSFDLVINGKTVKANHGETLVDAGLSGWVAIPHDCCSGQCETCRVTVVSGQVDDCGTAEKGTVLACQAKVIGNADDRLRRRAGRRQALRRRHRHDDARARHRRGRRHARHARSRCGPGQYLSVKFSGFPARDLSPTVRLDGTAGPGELVFHIRRYPGGLVSTQIGATIRPRSPRAGARPVRRRLPARGRWPADPDRRRHRLGADLGARRRRAARAAPSRPRGDRRQPRRRRASTCAARSNG